MSLVFTILFILPPGWNLFKKKKKLKHQERNIWTIWRIKTGRGTVLPVASLQVPMEQMEIPCKGKRTRIMAKVWKKTTDRHSVEEKNSGVVRKFVPPLKCVSLYHRDLRGLKTDVLFTRSLNNKICLLFHTSRCFLCLYHCAETRVSLSNWNSDGCFCFWEQPGYVNAVFATKVQTMIPLGK